MLPLVLQIVSNSTKCVYKAIQNTWPIFIKAQVVFFLEKGNIRKIINARKTKWCTSDHFQYLINRRPLKREIVSKPDKNNAFANLEFCLGDWKSSVDWQKVANPCILLVR